MKVEEMFNWDTFKLYKISPNTEGNIPDNYQNLLKEKIDELKLQNPNLKGTVYPNNTNSYEKVIVFLK